MTIDEAIAHAEEVAKEQDKYCPTPDGVSDPHKQCAEEHRQLAEWLKELKEKRQAIKNIRAEIDEEKNDYQAIGESRSDDTAYGLQLALDIIDKHLKGEEQE